jgi:citrate lyase beta subunit
VSASVAEVLDELDALLAPTDAALARRYPGPVADRQPVHTVYVPADAVTAETPALWGAAALALLDEHGDGLAGATGLDAGTVRDCLPRVRRVLATRPMDDLRIDCEDGYGARSDEEEDADASRAGATLAGWRDAAGAPLVVGIRCRSLDPATRGRAVRTIDRVLSAAIAAGGLPRRFVVTLPKLRAVAQAEAMVALCGRLEERHALAPGTLRFELQIETPQAILSSHGHVTVAPALHASAGRCVGLHFGTYDYSAACGITAAHQSLAHPAADFAKALMQAAAADTGVVVSDGSTNVLPVGDRAAVLAAWGLHARLVTRSLERGFYQGWDLHPGQLVTRHLATIAFYRSAFPAAAARLSAYLRGANSRAAILDEPATARALAAVVVRGLDCGAIDDDEAADATALATDALRAVARTGRPA